MKDDAQKNADQRASDHLTWLTSNELTKAFDTYDREYPIPEVASDITPDAYGFTAAADLCFFGIDGCKAYDKLLDQWIASLTIDNSNLFFRSYCYNNTQIEEQIKKAFADIKPLVAGLKPGEDASDIFGGTVSAFAGVTSLMKKFDSAFDEWDRNRWQNPGFAETTLDRNLFFKGAMKTRTVFRSGLGGKLDQKLVAALGGLTYARLGDLAKDLAKDDLTAMTGKYWTAKRKEAQAKQYGQRAHGSLHDVLQDARKKASERVSKTIEEHAKKKPSTNNFHQARMGALLGTLEIISLANRLKDFKGDERAWAELASSVLTLGSRVTHEK